MVTGGVLPLADTIPVAWGWFEVLLLATFAGHLLVMNAALGGSILALATRARPDGPNPMLTRRLPTIVALTVNLGIPPLLFLQVLYGQFFYTAAVLSAVFWMALFGLVMAAYALFYVQIKSLKKAPPGPVSCGALILAACVLLLVSFFMTCIMSLVIRPEAWTGYFASPHGTMLNLTDPTLIPRWLHFVFASLAIGGLYTALINHKSARQGNTPAAANATLGLNWFSWSSLLQMAAGVWWLMALPREVLLRLMGGEILHTVVLLAAVTMAVTAVVMGFKGRLIPAAAFLAATVPLMVGLRELVRSATLARHFNPTQLQVTGQYGPMLLFGVSFIVGGAAIAYLVKRHVQAGGGI